MRRELESARTATDMFNVIEKYYDVHNTEIKPMTKRILVAGISSQFNLDQGLKSKLEACSKLGQVITVMKAKYAGQSIEPAARPKLIKALIDILTMTRCKTKR